MFTGIQLLSLVATGYGVLAALAALLQLRGRGRRPPCCDASGRHPLPLVAPGYGVLAALAALLQMRQMLRRRTSCDVSARFFATYTGGYAHWPLLPLRAPAGPRPVRRPSAAP